MQKKPGAIIKYELLRLRRFGTVVALTTLWLCFNAANGCAVDLIGISDASSNDQTRIVLHLDGIPRYSVHQLSSTKQQPHRCYIDLFNTEPANSILQRITIDNENIWRIRTGTHGSMFRVVLDLKGDRRCSISVDFDSNRILMSVAGIPGSSAVAVQNSPSRTDQAAKPSTEPLQEREPVRDSDRIQKAETINIGALVTVDQSSESPPTPEAPLPGNLNAWGWLKGFAAVDTNRDEAEDTSMVWGTGRFGINWDMQLNEERLLQALFSANLDSTLAYNSDYTHNDTELAFHEGYLQLVEPTWDLSIGKQRVRWGKSDQISPLDSINPEDLRKFLTIPLEERKIPSLLGRLRIHGARTSFEAIVSPWFEKSELDYFDSDWALYRNLRQIFLTNPLLPAPIKEYAENLSVHEREPDRSVQNVTLASRFSWQTDQSDYAVSYRYGWETLPTVISFPVKGINYSGNPNSDPLEVLGKAVFTDEQVEVRYNRQTIAGLEWEGVYDLIGFRGEIAYLDKVSFLNSSLTSSRKSVGQIVAGIDYTSENEWYYNLQASWNKIFDYDDAILYFNRDNILVLVEVRKPIWRNNMELATRLTYSLTDQSSYFQPLLKIMYFANTEIEIGCMIFSGDGDTFLGSYDQADQIYTRIKRSF